MKYNSICSECGRETEKLDGLMEHSYNKREQGFVTVIINTGFRVLDRTFCPSCQNKSLTIKDLLKPCNYNQWSY